MNAIITCSDLKKRIQAGALVLDVMTPEEYAACHLVGAKNACIYEMVFLDRVAECIPDRDTDIVVYDTTGTKQTAKLALERLIQAGYSSVSILEGGLSAWRTAGLPIEESDRVVVAEPGLQDGTYTVDVEKSMLEWIGRNLNNRHYGRIAVQDGGIVIIGGRVSAGSIVLDMNTITNLDLQDATWRNMLIRHLKSDDFFSVERFPTASFRLTGWEEKEGGSPEALNGIAAGELTIRDITRPISFPAIVSPQADGSIKAHAAFEVDRTLWNVCYGSGKLFECLGMHLVHDIITLELFVLARQNR